MKTTIDLPETLLHRAKVTAAQRKTTLKDLVVQGLEYAMSHEIPDPETERKSRTANLLKALSGIKITEPVGTFHREEIYDRQKGRWE